MSKSKQEAPVKTMPWTFKRAFDELPLTNNEPKVVIIIPPI